jgi:hypothetical protein
MLLGAVMIGVQPARFSWRVFSLFVYLALSAVVFGYWRLLSRPELTNPVF